MDTTKLPPLPYPDGGINIRVLYETVTVDAFRASTVKDYGKSCAAAARAKALTDVMFAIQNADCFVNDWAGMRRAAEVVSQLRDKE